MNETELSQIGENLRFYGDMRFKQLTLFMAWLTVAAFGVAEHGSEPIIGSIYLRLLIAFASLVFTAVMWIMEVRSTIYWVAQREKAPDIWPRPNNVRMGFLNATNAVLTLYLSVFAFWLVAVWNWNGAVWANSVFSLVGVVLVLFSALNYWQLWTYTPPQRGGRPVAGQATVNVLKGFLDAFNRHDLDAIMDYFADDCVFYMPRGAKPRGDQYTGKTAVRAGLAKRFEGVPDVHYGNDQHWVCGNFGVSEWTLTGTTTSGQRIEVRGVDLLEFAQGKITRKDSFWKIID